MRGTRNQNGFTLVEVMVAMAIVGVISVVIYRLFDVTSDNFQEVDQLADANDRLRFALERVRNDVQAAGAQSTPDSAIDPWVEPKPNSPIRVSGLVPYPGWQNDTSVALPAVAARNPNTSFDGLVVIGAFDFPLAFEMGGLEDTGGQRLGTIEAHYKGLWRMLTQDPFMSGLQNFPAVTAAQVDGLGRGTNWSSRLLRLTDRQGYMQFMHPEDIDGPFANPGGFDFVQIRVPNDNTDFGPKFKSSAAGWFGLDNLNEGDVAYDAALLDAYWIHAMRDPSNDKIVNLVRDRLCALEVAQSGFTAGWTPDAALANTCPGVAENERVVLASNLADFQVWFDCAVPDALSPHNGAIMNGAWSYNWDPPDGAGTCMDPALPNPGLVRAAHVRIALHTRSEHKDQPHLQFEDLQGFVCEPNNPANCLRPIDGLSLRTYDLYPDSQGATRVTVMQSDFEVVNFVNRNAMPTP